MQNNVSIALQKMGGYKEVVTRGCEHDPIVIEIKFRMQITGKNRLVTYHLEIATDNRDYLLYDVKSFGINAGSQGSPYHFLDFAGGGRVCH